MAIKITDDCINCGACEPECPNNAIYEGAVDWKASDGTSLKGAIVMPSGLSIDADEPVYTSAIILSVKSVFFG